MEVQPVHWLVEKVTIPPIKRQVKNTITYGYMEPSIEIFDTVLNPTAAFSPTPGFRQDINSEQSWETSYLNPKNRIDSLTPVKHPTWRIDGVDVDGTCFFAVPTFALGSPPLRIDIHIPDQNEHPPALRTVLKSGSVMLLKSSDAAQLEISQHVLRALEAWSLRVQDFQYQYLQLPFGSKITINNIRSDVQKMEISMIPVYETEQNWLSIKDLQEMWRFPPSVWPPVVEHNELSLQRQPHEAISVVRIPSQHGLENFVFKSLTKGLRYLYHELKMFLSLPPHPNIIRRPLYIVTKKGRFGGKQGVCGFVLPYYSFGNLRDVLSASACGRIEITLEDQIRWARQITSALLHIINSPVRFYSDLKPDNVLLHRENGRTNVVLIDFEQRGGWYSWTAPEVAYVEYVEYLATRLPIDDQDRNNYMHLLKTLVPDWNSADNASKYVNTSRGFNFPWLLQTPEQAEKAMVFSLGKILWCIFEKACSINCGIGIDMLREDELGPSFPSFRRAFLDIQHCIRECTHGAPEWYGRYRTIRKANGRCVPINKLVRNVMGTKAVDRDVRCTPQLVGLQDTRQIRSLNADEYLEVNIQEAASRWWKREVDLAKMYLEWRIENVSSKEADKDVEELGLLSASRPALREMSDLLQEIEKKLVVPN